MTRNAQPARHGALYWAGMTLLALWNVGMLYFAIASKQAYDRCMASDGFLCLDFSGQILVVLFAVDAVVALIAAIVHWLRLRRAQ
jgi:hypothetical protein